MQPRYWMGSVPEQDDFGDSISDEFIDGATECGRCEFRLQEAQGAFFVVDP